MTVAERKPRMTRDEFFRWAEEDGGRWEFDGFAPVAMGGGTIGHHRITRNLSATLTSRLRGKACEPFGPEAGIATIGDTVRYPDAVISYTPVGNDARLVPEPVVVFEVLSPSTSRVDRITKLGEYRFVESVQCYVILESQSAEASVMTRAAHSPKWEVVEVKSDGTLLLPYVDLEIPLAEIYEGVEFAPFQDDGR